MANPFVHVELNTDDPAKARAFYAKVFRWQLEDVPMPGGPYTMVKVGDGTGGGILKKPMPSAPTAWLPYVQVDDLAKTIAAAREHGAQIVLEKTEVPGMGVYGIFVDPTGAALGVWERR